MKRPINHVRNLQYSIAATVLIAFVVSVANPINGWVFGLITIVIVALPLTLITVIVQNVVTRRNPPAAEPKTTPAEAEADNAQAAASDMDDPQEAARSFKVAGRVHLGIGLFVLILAVVNLFIAQTLPLWTRMFAVPFWWIIAACSIVSFVLANKNYYKAEQLTPKQENSGQNQG